VIRVEIAATFADRLTALEEFVLAQDAASAPARCEELRGEILRFIDLVKLHPQIGRLADVLAACSVDGTTKLELVLQQAAAAGLPHLREYVLKNHLVLYAHSDGRVLLLSLRHHRELGYAAEAPQR
jgi:hypothetical protein